MNQSVAHFEELFFSEGVLGTGSVREYFTEVTNGLVDLTGEVLGPYRLPLDMAEYAHGDSGTGMVAPNARTMANDAAAAADADLDFDPYDNDGNGFVDAFVVVHAGSGAEQTARSTTSGRTSGCCRAAAHRRQHQDLRLSDRPRGRPHRRVRPRARPPAVRLPRPVRHRQHVGGHRQLVPDGGRQLGRRRSTRPTHPSAWCKAQQAWVTVENVTTNGTAVDPRRQGLPHRVPALEGRRRRPGVLPRREPPGRPQATSACPGAAS